MSSLSGKERGTQKTKREIASSLCIVSISTGHSLAEGALQNMDNQKDQKKNRIPSFTFVCSH